MGEQGMSMSEEENIQSPVNHFRGRSDHNLDGKGRLNIPARFRDVLRRQGDERLMVMPWKECLRAYPLPEWEAMETRLRAAGNSQPGLLKMVRYMVGGVVECPLDKQGRILVSAKMRADCGIEKEILVSGMIDYFEIWDRAKWEVDNKPSAEDFKNYEQILLDMGLF